MALGVMKVIGIDFVVVLIFYSFNNLLSVLEFIKYLCEWIRLLSNYHNTTNVVCLHPSSHQETRCIWMLVIYRPLTFKEVSTSMTGSLHSGTPSRFACIPPMTPQIHESATSCFPVIKLTLALEDPIPGCHASPPPPPVLLDGEEHFKV